MLFGSHTVPFDRLTAVSLTDAVVVEKHRVALLSAQGAAPMSQAGAGPSPLTRRPAKREPAWTSAGWTHSDKVNLGRSTNGAKSARLADVAPSAKHSAGSSAPGTVALATSPPVHANAAASAGVPTMAITGSGTAAGGRES